MFSTLFTIALLAAPALADFAISTPSFVQCQSAEISWQATTAPYNLIVVAADDPCGDALLDLGDHDGTYIHWTAALPAGSTIQLSLEDATGDEAWSGVIIVAASNDTSCIPSSLVNLVQSEAAVASASAASASKTSSSVKASATSSQGGSTLTVTPTLTVQASSSTGGVSPSAVGAAAADPLLGNGAASVRQSTPLVLLGALAAVLAFSL